MAGLVPAIPLRRAQCVPKRGHRDIRAFTPVFDGLSPVTTTNYSFAPFSLKNFTAPGCHGSGELAFTWFSTVKLLASL